MENIESDIIGKLDLLIETLALTNRLLVLIATEDKNLAKDKIEKLLGIGIRPKDIAHLLNIPLGSVTKTKSRVLGKTEH